VTQARGQTASDPGVRGDSLTGELAGIVGQPHVLTDPDVVASYEVDWTNRWRGRARLVVRPGSTEEVASVLAACTRHAAPIVPQGGNTGLVGGGVPRAGEVVMSLCRLDGIGPVDVVAGQVRAGAGATLARVQQRAQAAGCEFGVDLAARESATVGGMVATNAGGVHVVRYGAMRANVIGLEIVLADGKVITRMDGLVKDNTGYDLVGLLVGSEGTLGIVTAAQLRLVPQCTERVVVVVPVPDLAQAVSICGALRRRLPDLQALEAIDARGIELVTTFGELPPLYRDRSLPPWTLLVECASTRSVMDDVTAGLADLVDLDSALVATEPGRRGELWSYRERLTASIARAGIAHKLDVTLPFPRLPSFEAELRSRLASAFPGVEPVLFGHLGDGNLHVNLLGVDPDDDEIDEAVLTLVAQNGGSISAEHGIGTVKRRFVALTRSAADIETMRTIKVALDPGNLLNPGVLLP